MENNRSWYNILFDADPDPTLNKAKLITGKS